MYLKKGFIFFMSMIQPLQKHKEKFSIVNLYNKSKKGD
jgi:hypothetical protein